MAQLCELWHCPPSVVDQQDAARVEDALIYLEARSKAQQVQAAG